MTTKSGIRPKPEEELQQKQQELGELEKQLIDRELQLVSLRRELAAFERLYAQKVGARYNARRSNCAHGSSASDAKPVLTVQPASSEFQLSNSAVQSRHVQLPRIAKV